MKVQVRVNERGALRNGRFAFTNKLTLVSELLENARRDYDRMAKIPGVMAQKTMDTQQAQIGQLEAQIKADDAAIAATRTTLAYTRVTAPISGRTGLGPNTIFRTSIVIIDSPSVTSKVRVWRSGLSNTGLTSRRSVRIPRGSIKRGTIATATQKLTPRASSRKPE